jgi:hypothetical protein
MWHDSPATSAVASARPTDMAAQSRQGMWRESTESRHAAWHDQKGYFLQIQLGVGYF